MLGRPLALVRDHRPGDIFLVACLGGEVAAGVIVFIAGEGYRGMLALMGILSDGGEEELFLVPPLVTVVEGDLRQVGARGGPGCHCLFEVHAALSTPKGMLDLSWYFYVFILIQSLSWCRRIQSESEPASESDSGGGSFFFFFFPPPLLVEPSESLMWRRTSSRRIRPSRPEPRMDPSSSLPMPLDLASWRARGEMLISSSSSSSSQPSTSFRRMRPSLPVPVLPARERPRSLARLRALGEQRTRDLTGLAKCFSTSASVHLPFLPEPAPFGSLKPRVAASSSAFLLANFDASTPPLGMSFLGRSSCLARKERASSWAKSYLRASVSRMAVRVLAEVAMSVVSCL